MGWSDAWLAIAKIKNPDLDRAGKTAKPAKKRTKGAASAAPDVLEHVIQAEVTRMLEHEGWRALRTDPVSDRSKGKGFGEPGMPDYLYIKYEKWTYIGNKKGASTAQCMWIEFKRGRGGVVSEDQRKWHSRERSRGALTLIAGEDFPASVEGFEEWYRGNL